MSRYPYASTSADAYDKLKTFFDLLNALYDFDALDIARFRIGTEQYMQWKIFPDFSIQEILSRPENKVYKDFFYSHFACPHIEDPTISERIEHDRPTLLWASKEIPCVGLAAAYYTRTLAISMHSDEFWRNVVFTLKINGQDQRVLALAHKDDMEKEEFLRFVAETKPTVIRTTEENPNDKPFNTCGDHHGKENLKRLWNRLKYNKYVEACLISIENNSYATDPILNYYSDGTIDVVDVTSDEGYAMKIQTTAKDIYETERVADILRQKLS
ncbi:MAG: hypothetical protein MJZ79_07745 [Paludibacteraceae bacterium]|nr:hypothetical protein [Paludibacteraceae bacterium]